MNKTILVAMIMLSMATPSLAAECKWSEGDDVLLSGGRSNEGHCKAFGNVEQVNKTCTKAKVSFSKVTNIFGMASPAVCRFGSIAVAAGDLPWLPVEALSQ